MTHPVTKVENKVVLGELKVTYDGNADTLDVQFEKPQENCIEFEHFLGYKFTFSPDGERIVSFKMNGVGQMVDAARKNADDPNGPPAVNGIQPLRTRG